MASLLQALVIVPGKISQTEIEPISCMQSVGNSHLCFYSKLKTYLLAMLIRNNNF